LAFTGPLGLVACAKGILLARSPESPMRWPPSSAANESWPHEQFCQSAFDALKAVVARGTPRAAIHSRLRWSRPRLVHVRFTSDSDRQPSKRDPSLRARKRHHTYTGSARATRKYSLFAIPRHGSARSHLNSYMAGRVAAIRLKNSEQFS
jgi:hypothetical protein